MEPTEILHMPNPSNTPAYIMFSRKYDRLMRPEIEKAIRSLLQDDTMKQKTLCAVDLGCGIGPSPVAFISTTVNSVQNICDALKWDDSDVPEIQLFLCDLPSNDYNFLFKDMERVQNRLKENSKPSCFIMGSPGSFYERLFPRNSLHLVHSYYAIHMLSQVPDGLLGAEGEPLNKGKICVSETTVPEVKKAYYDQFESDFSVLLNCRSHEVAPNGYMVLATPCRPSTQPREGRALKLLFQALERLVSKGVVNQDKLDHFNLAVYYPCPEEIQEIVAKQGSFAVQNWRVVSSEVQKARSNAEPRSMQLARIIRSYTQEPVLTHFGEQIWNELHRELRQVILEYFRSDGPLDMFDIVISLKRKID